jgi:hypothetical protein
MTGRPPHDLRPILYPERLAATLACLLPQEHRDELRHDKAGSNVLGYSTFITMLMQTVARTGEPSSDADRAAPRAHADDRLARHRQEQAHRQDSRGLPPPPVGERPQRAAAISLAEAENEQEADMTTSTQSLSERLRRIADGALEYESDEAVVREAADAIVAKDAEIARLRAAIAQSKSPCIYCSLPAEEWAKCQHGFPGCDRADDAVGCPELGARLEFAQQSALLAQAAAALEQLIADIRDYERTNNLAPTPGKQDCWQSVTHAREALAAIREVKP